MDDKAFHAQIIAFQMNKMCRGMRPHEFRVYCLAHKHIWEGVPLKWWINSFDERFKYLIRRVLRENLTEKRRLIVNWYPLRGTLVRSFNQNDPAFVRHCFDHQPQRN